MHLAGEPLASEKQRARSASPARGTNLVEMMLINVLNTQEEQDDIMGAEGGETNEDEMPLQHEGEDEIVNENKVIDTDTRPVWEKMQDQVEELQKKVARHFEDRNDQSGQSPPIVKSPQQPTAEEWEKHQVTHTPYAPWCQHCNAARAVRRDHARIKQRIHLVRDVDGSQMGPVKMSMDYMYLYDRKDKHRDEQCNPPHLVVTEHRFGRLWAHRVLNKGVNNEASWLPKRVLQDLDNAGFQDMRVIAKTDQEPAIVELQIAMQEARPNMIIPINSIVGESESNVRAENSIQRLQEKIRTLRHHVEQHAKMKIPEQSPLMAWLVRWSAEFISKYTRGDDGKSPYERIRGEPSGVPLVPFGEKVMYFLVEIVKKQKGEAAEMPGIWLAVNERIEENLVGTERGVIKCRTVSRLCNGDAWGRGMLVKIQGVLWQPLPGNSDARVPVAIGDDGDIEDDDDVVPHELNEDEKEDIQQPTFRRGPGRFHVSREVAATFGTTEGCRACTAIRRMGNRKYKFVYNHNDECRQRITRLMQEDPEYMGGWRNMDMQILQH